MTTLLFLLAAALPLPAQPTGKCVLDEAGVLAPADLAALEQACEALDRSGAGQFEVVVTDDFRERDRDEFANDLFHGWKIGHAGKDDGLLILLSPKLRKWRIEVGYGLEGRVTDARAAEIGREAGVPYWKGSEWGAGLKAVVAQLVPLMQAEHAASAVDTAEHPPAPVSDNAWIGILVMLALVGGVFFVVMLLVWQNRKAEKEEQERRAKNRALARAVATIPPPPPNQTRLSWPTPPRAVAVIHLDDHRRPPEPPPPVRPADDDDRAPTWTASAPSSYDSGGGFGGGGFSGGGGGDSGGGGAGGDF